jgi:hypothetical protein
MSQNFFHCILVLSLTNKVQVIAPSVPVLVFLIFLCMISVALPSLIPVSMKFFPFSSLSFFLYPRETDGA